MMVMGMDIVVSFLFINFILTRVCVYGTRSPSDIVLMNVAGGLRREASQIRGR